MAARFASYLLVLVLAAFVALVRFIIGADPVRWITFGTGAAVTVAVAEPAVSRLDALRHP